MQITKKTFSNGLRALHVASTDAQSVTIMFLVAVGARYEQENEAGLAHFVEHTLFKGTTRRPSSKQLSMEIESLGANTNAFTSYEYTGYYIKTPAENFVPAFDILADLFQHPLFEEKELALEGGVIVEEIRMYEDRPTAKVAQEWNRNFFGSNNLAKDLAGTIESVKGMKKEQFQNFVAKHYNAENTLLVVAGNVDWSNVEAQVEQLCLSIPSRSEKQLPASEYTKFSEDQAQGKKIKLFIEKDLEQAHIVLGGTSLNNDDPKRFALQMANTILGSGFGSKLIQLLREELGLAYYVYSHISGYRDTGVYQIGMGVDQNRVNEVLSVVQKLLAEYRAGQFSAEEFTRAKNYLLGSMVTELETSEDIAMYYGMQELLQTDKLDINQVKERIKAVTREDVLAIVNEIYREDNLYQAVLSRKFTETT